MGDYLARTGNPLASPMRLRRNGQPLTLEKKAPSSAVPPPRDKLLALVHGLCMNDLQWTQKGSDFGAALVRDLGIHSDPFALQQRFAHVHQRAFVCCFD